MTELIKDGVTMDSSEFPTLYPDTIFPATNPWGDWQEVFKAPQPSYDALTQALQELAPVVVDDHWERPWQVVALPAEAAATNRAAAVAIKWEAIKAERDRRKFNGVLVNTKWIHTDTFSRSQWLGMLMMGAALPEIEWTTMDGSTTTTTPALAASVLQAVAVLDTTTFTVAKAHRAALLLADNPNTYDFSANWPATYEG